MMPHLLYERLDEIGTDFAIIYPTAGLRLPRIKDDATRRAGVRAHNNGSGGGFKGPKDRVTPAPSNPMDAPGEAREELEFVTSQLGSKVGMFGSAMPRQTASITKGENVDTDRLAVWYEVFGIDSIYDYDPVWETCRKLGIAPTFHSAGSNQALRNSP